MGGALFVAGEDQLDLGVHQRVEYRHDGAAREPKDVLHAFPLQALDDLLATGREFLVSVFLNVQKMAPRVHIRLPSLSQLEDFSIETSLFSLKSDNPHGD